MKVEISKKALYVIGGVIALVLVLGISLFAYNQYQEKVERDEKIELEKKQAAEKKKKEEAEKKMATEFDTLFSELTVNGMVLSSSAEKIGDQYITVWQDAIFEDGGAEVAGKKYTDFNEAIQAQSDVFETGGDSASLDTQIGTFNDTYSDLKKNLTSENESNMEDAKDFYDKAITFVTLAKNPTGNLTTFSTSYNEAKSDFISVMNTFSDNSFSE